MYHTTPPLETTKSMEGKLEAPQKTFFFERQDGDIFSVNEAEAWTIYKGKSQTVGYRITPPKLIGVSDGVSYYEALKEAKTIFATQGIDKAQEHIRKAFNAEIEIARGKIVAPRNFDMVDDRGNPVKLSDLR